jgi:hypothetical protein
LGGFSGKIRRAMMEDERFKAIVDSLPEKRPRSRLGPYTELIDHLRKLGRTYREIERILLEKCGIHAPRCTINDFVRHRSRRKTKVQKSPPMSVENANLPTTVSAGEKEPLHPQKELPGIDDAYRRISALKQSKPSAPKTADLFHYDPNEPLRLPKKSESRNTGD